MKTYSNFSEVCDEKWCKYVLVCIVLLLSAVIVLYVLAQIFVCLKCCFFCCYNPDLFRFNDNEVKDSESSDVLGTNYQPPPRKSKRLSEVESGANNNNKNINEEKVELGTTVPTTSVVINSLQGTAIDI